MNRVSNEVQMVADLHLTLIWQHRSLDLTRKRWIGAENEVKRQHAIRLQKHEIVVLLHSTFLVDAHAVRVEQQYAVYLS